MKNLSIVAVVKNTDGKIQVFSDTKELEEQKNREKMLVEINKRLEWFLNGVAITQGTLVSVSHSIFAL